MEKIFFRTIQDDYIKKLLRIFFALQVLCLTICFLKWNELPPELPIYYSLPKGPDQLGTPLSFIIIYISSIVIFLLNYLFASLLYHSEKIAAYILITAGTVFSFLIGISFLKIIFLIT